jgi:hypothetical protein
LGSGELARYVPAASEFTTSRYARLDADPLRPAAESIGARITAAMERKKGAEIAPLKPVGKLA